MPNTNCPYLNNIVSINDTQCLVDTLPIINNNFANLQNSICEVYNTFLARRETRTFFYYGPESETIATSEQDNFIATYPSLLTIQSFVNDSDKLDVGRISYPGDTVFVIYQKTARRQTLDKQTNNTSDVTTGTTDGGITGPIPTTSPLYQTWNNWKNWTVTIPPVVVNTARAASTKTTKIDRGYANNYSAQDIPLRLEKTYDTANFSRVRASINGTNNSPGMVLITLTDPNGSVTEYYYSAPFTYTSSQLVTIIDWDIENNKLYYKYGTWTASNVYTETIEDTIITSIPNGTVSRFDSNWKFKITYPFDGIEPNTPSGTQRIADILDYLPTYFVYRLVYTLQDNKDLPDYGLYYYKADDSSPRVLANITDDLSQSGFVGATWQSPSTWPRIRYPLN